MQGMLNSTYSIEHKYVHSQITKVLLHLHHKNKQQTQESDLCVFHCVIYTTNSTNNTNCLWRDDDIMDNSRRQSALPGLELSPIGAPMPNSAFSPAWNRYAASSSSPFVAHNIVPDIQRFIAADDTDNDKLRMV